jgi:hypothetical protein
MLPHVEGANSARYDFLSVPFRLRELHRANTYSDGTYLAGVSLRGYTMVTPFCDISQT